MLAAINIQWKQLRPDLRNSPDELRDERLAFITHELSLKRPLESMQSLSDKQLGRVLDAFKRMQAQPSLMGVEPLARQSAEIIHLATAEQTFTITNLLDYLRWSDDARRDFLNKKFRRGSAAMLTTRQANSLTMILMTIASYRDLRGSDETMSVSREQVRKYIPILKRKLGIDNKG